MSQSPSATEPIVDRQQLVDYFHAGNKGTDARKVGTEHEKFVIRRSDGAMVSFEEPGGFGDLFVHLIDRFNWRPGAVEDGQAVSVVGDNGSVTLEPGGQFELSGGIHRTIFETAREFDEHIAQVKEIAGDDLYFVIWGLNPMVTLDEVPWMPKGRYRIMRRYLPTRGEQAHWMMKTTCTIQGNYDYCSEADAVDLIHTAVLASPLVGALFANSPLRAGEPTGMQSTRNHIWWAGTDPDRTGVPDFMYRTDWGFEDYLEYILDVPMFFIERDGRYLEMTGHSFRDFLDHGHQGFEATMADFELHLSTAFPDIRLKQFVETRSADGGPRDAVLALPALWKGLLYDQEARRETVALFDPLNEAHHRQMIVTCYTDGIHGQSHFGPVAELADELVAISHRGLQRIADRDETPDETPFLDPLRERLDLRRSWADELLDDVRELGPDLGKLADRWAL